jgi:membrane fusion protein (multidrug efflux system)
MTTKTKKQMGVLTGTLLLIVGSAWAFFGGHAESTDNAYVQANVAALSPKVPGLVTQVLVQENQKVKKDQILMVIDPRDYQNALDEQQAQLRSVEASLTLARKDQKRAVELFAEEAVSAQYRDAAVAKLQELQDQWDSLRAQIQQSELNLQYTFLRAPADGTVGKKSVEAGMVVAPGEPLMAFVDSATPWVDANFKETQLRRIRPGQRALVSIDSIGGKKFDAVVESIAPGTGATFALIPPENATGNFTKIVQRVPVRLRFLVDSIKGYEDRIVPGLSVEAKIYTN